MSPEQAHQCIVMTSRRDAVDFMATRDKIMEAIDAAYARGLADGRKEGLDSSKPPPPPNGLRRVNGVVAAPEGHVLLDDGTIRRVMTDTGDEDMPCAGRMFGPFDGDHITLRCGQRALILHAAEAAKEQKQ